MSLTLKDVVVDNIGDIENVVHYFDEIMAIYDLIGTYSSVRVVANDNNKQDISFDIIFGGYDEAQRLYSVIQRQEVSKYGHIYVPIVTLNYNILNVKLIDRLL